MLWAVAGRGHRRLLRGEKPVHQQRLQELLAGQKQADGVVLGDHPFEVRELLLDRPARRARGRPGSGSAPASASTLASSSGRPLSTVEVAEDARVHKERALVAIRQVQDDALDGQAVAVGGGELGPALLEHDVHAGEGQAGGLGGLEGGE
ncbi:MAG: hypothetical protein ABDI20_09565, partial [Candidatus Bipolaricaulaceae bacterium]